MWLFGVFLLIAAIDVSCGNGYKFWRKDTEAFHDDTDINCTVELEPMVFSFDGSGDEGIKVFDRISTLTFRKAADFTYGGNPSMIRPFNKIFLPCIKPGTTIFVETCLIFSFLSQFWTDITVPIILISGGGDASFPPPNYRVNNIPNDYASIDETTNLFKSVLDSPVLLHWYAQNCDFRRKSSPMVSRKQMNGKLTCIPLGIQPQMNNLQQIQKYYERNEGLDQGRRHANDEITKSLKDVFVVASFQEYPWFHDHTRQYVKKVVCDPEGSFRNLADCSHYKNIVDYYRSVSRAKFVLSPEGVGVDTFRTYEVLFCNSIPVVQTLDDAITDSDIADGSTENLSSLALHGLPAVILNNWTDLSVERLTEEYDRMGHIMDQADYSPLFIGYWEKKFHSHRAVEMQNKRFKYALPYFHDTSDRSFDLTMVLESSGPWLHDTRTFCSNPK